MLRALLNWLVSKSLLFLLLFAGVAVFTLFGPIIERSLTISAVRDETSSLQEVKTELARVRKAEQRELTRNVETYRNKGAGRLRERAAQVEHQLQDARSRREERQGFLGAMRPSKILERGKLDLRISALEKEKLALQSALQAADARIQLEDKAAALRRMPIISKQLVDKKRQDCEAAKAGFREFQNRNIVDKALRDAFGGERVKLEDAAGRECGQARRFEEQYASSELAKRHYEAARLNLNRIQGWTVAPLPDVTAGITQQTIADMAIKAFLGLVALILLPLGIRVVFYFLLAPAAERRSPITFAAARGNIEAAMARSAVSVSVTLRPNEELLVRQGYLQSSSGTGRKRTRLILSWRYFLASLASGLYFLTQVRGLGARAVISADDDPFAECALLELPSGAACILQPRAIVAVIQQIDTPLTITSRWRLGLHAWLSWQFRYLMFHGPALLVIKGGRGVRSEAAERGRIFKPQQLIGFSSSLVYGTARNETFWPYFVGRDDLLKDRVEGGYGLLILEAASNNGTEKGRSTRGLEGKFDAVLKAFGI